jgi:two-component system chemotaxis sensor kinase CheA
VVRIGDALGNSSPDAAGVPEYLVIVKGGEHTAGILVDRLLEQQEFVIKTLGNYLGKLHGIAGATILGNGQTALILDVPALLRHNIERKKPGMVPAAV